MYIPLIWQFESDVKKLEGSEVVKKNDMCSYLYILERDYFLFYFEGNNASITRNI